MVIKRRAISDKQKQQRRQHILDITRQMFRDTAYEAVNIAQVAKQAGMAKGTVYLYFNTKEALFLALQAQAFTAWFDDVDSRLDAIRREQRVCSAAALARLLADALERHPPLVRLIAILHTILEQNIDAATALAFKQMLFERVTRTGALLEACLPVLETGQGRRLLLHIHALVIGLQHLAAPAPIVQQVLAEQPDLQMFAVDFRTEFLTTLTTLLKGLEK